MKHIAINACSCLTQNRNSPQASVFFVVLNVLFVINPHLKTNKFTLSSFDSLQMSNS